MGGSRNQAWKTDHGALFGTASAIIALAAHHRISKLCKRCDAGIKESNDQVLAVSYVFGQLWSCKIAGAMVTFPDKDAAQHNSQIIECSWDAKNKSWTYMRERRDKATPNAWHVYEKVLQSIKDDITPGRLVEYIKKAIAGNDVYAKAKDKVSNDQKSASEKPGQP